jgi:hypothetical protein
MAGWVMKCPKCGIEQDTGTGICIACGLVFEKYYKYHPRPGDALPLVAITPEPDRPDSLRDLILPAEVGGDWTGIVGRGLVFVVLCLWGSYLSLSSIGSNAAGVSFLHMINLPFHEAGHVLFMPFGAFLHSFGGTLGQLLMPAICAAVLLLQTRDPFGASVGLWWLGENFLDIAPYINDARAGRLPLLGGNTGHLAPYGFHDWEYLLGESGLLRWDHALARGSHLLGAMIMTLALVWGGLLLYRQYRGLKRG